MVSGLLHWLEAVPLAVLYAAMFVISLVENVFPPVPADSVVAVGSWLAARGEGSAIVAFLMTWMGNVAGAAGMYLVGRRHGSRFMRHRFPTLADAQGEERLRAVYARYGIAALVVSRFVPGVRALVPPFAGALHIPAGIAISAIAVASAAWYGGISYLAFRAGADWGELVALVSRSGRVTAVVAGALLAAGALVWLVRRRRSRSAT